MRKKIISILTFLIGVVVGGGMMNNRAGRKLEEKQELSDKHLSLFLLMNEWVKIHQEGKDLSRYFKKNGYKNIAIYGISYAGETLLNELKETDVQVIYLIDKNQCKTIDGITLYSIEDDLEDVDAVIVTAITFFDEIREGLEEKVICPIISLEEVVYEV